MTREIQVEGKDVAQAVEKGLKELGLRRDQVEVTILSEGSGGFLGLGAKQAAVRIREKRWMGEEPRPQAPSNNKGAAAAPPAKASPAEAQQAVEAAKGALQEILNLTGLGQARVSAQWDDAQNRIKAEVECEDSRLLIGKDGATLRALQLLVGLIVHKRNKTQIPIQVDVAGYRKSQEEKVLTQIRSVVEEVKRTGRIYRLEPMDSSLRRLVHKALANSPEVETASEGEGSLRKVVIKPKKR